MESGLRVRNKAEALLPPAKIVARQKARSAPDIAHKIVPFERVSPTDFTASNRHQPTASAARYFVAIPAFVSAQSAPEFAAATPTSQTLPDRQPR